DRRRSVTPVVVIGAVHPDFRLVDNSCRDRALILHDDIGGNMGNYVMASQSIGGIVNVGVINVVTHIGGVVVVESIVETGHTGVFANCVSCHFSHFIGNAVNRPLADRIGI